MKRALPWLLAAIAVCVAIWLARKPQHTDGSSRALQDSLATLRVQYSQLEEIGRQQEAVLHLSNRLLDSALSKAPRVVYVTRRDTIRSGVDSGVVSVVDSLPYVPKADYDTLASRCSVVQRDCTALLATKDSALTVRRKELEVSERARVEDRRRLLSNVRVVGLKGFGLGLGSGLVLCALWCR